MRCSKCGAGNPERAKNAFYRKGRMNELLERIPVKTILNDGTAQHGAAGAAALSAGLI